MSYARQMLDTFSRTVDVDADLLAAAIDAMSDCAQACTAAQAVTSRLVDYDPAVLRPLLESCVAICRSCGDECERHAPMHAHCRVCAEACRRCEQACRALLAALP